MYWDFRKILLDSLIEINLLLLKLIQFSIFCLLYYLFMVFVFCELVTIYFVN